MKNRNNVVVVGGGIVGLWTALHLARRSVDVTLIESGSIGSGASFGNCGYVSPSHVYPLCGPGAVVDGLRMMVKSGGALSIPPRWDPTLWRWLIAFARHCNARHYESAALGRHALLQSSRRQYEEFAAARQVAIKWQPRGLLNVYRSKKDFESFAKTAEPLRGQFGMDVIRYEGDQLLELEPSLRDGLAGGWYYPNDAHLAPMNLLNETRKEAELAGVIIREHTNVIDLAIERGTLRSLIAGNTEPISADRFVFCLGAECGWLGPKLGCRLPVVPGKGYSVTMDVSDQEAEQLPRVPMIFEHDHVAVTPLGNQFRIGSTMQLTGFDRSIPDRRINLLKHSTREHLRVQVPQGNESRWSGWRPMTPDGLPLIGSASSIANAFIAAGNGMIGIASGPGTGLLAAQLVVGETPMFDPEPFRLDRFT